MVRTAFSAGGYALFLLALFLMLFSCNPATHSSTETDTPDHDNTDLADLDMLIDESLGEDDASDEWYDDAVMPDKDIDLFGETDVDCAPWVSDGDPYADVESAAMQWYGDFDVIAKDPENVRDLWARIYHYTKDEPVWRLVKPYDRCAKDYPLEAAMVEDENNLPDTLCNNNNGKDTIRSFSCDTLINPGRCWAMNWWMGQEPVWQENNGKVFVELFNPNNTYFVQGEGGYYFDIEKRQMIKLVGKFDGNSVATNGRYTFFSVFDNAYQSSWPDRGYYVDDTTLFTFAYYDAENNLYGIAYKSGKIGAVADVQANEKYLILSIQDQIDISTTRVIYTKIGEWNNWKQLKAHNNPELDRVGRPYLRDHYVAFYNWDFVIQHCDLDIGTESCKVVSRHTPGGGITARNPVISMDNKHIYYDELLGDVVQNRESTIVEADISDLNDIKHLEISHHSKNLSVSDIDERFLVYSKEIGVDASTTSEYPFYVACFYRFTDGKTFCLENDHDSDTSASVSKVEIKQWDKYLVYGNNYGSLILRDMECYCKAYPDTCPYEEYASKKARKR